MFETTPSDYPWKSISLDGRKIRELVAACRANGVPYKLGGKARSLTATPASLKGGIDCSGFVRWAVWQASPPDARVTMPDGSWHQAAWAEKEGFKESTVEACLLRDGRIRLAYWANRSGVSHVILVLNGKTLESHGAKGPNRRTWDLRVGWMKRSKVWCLDMDSDDAKVT
jgi:cell wall-associated NlpC family hydrolase